MYIYRSQNHLMQHLLPTWYAALDSNSIPQWKTLAHPWQNFPLYQLEGPIEREGWGEGWGYLLTRKPQWHELIAIWQKCGLEDDIPIKKASIFFKKGTWDSGGANLEELNLPFGAVGWNNNDVRSSEVGHLKGNWLPDFLTCGDSGKKYIRQIGRVFFVKKFSSQMAFRRIATPLYRILIVITWFAIPIG